MTASRILIVDDDAALLQALPEALRLRMPELAVDTSDSALAALERIALTDYDAIVSDIKMPGMDGLALLEKVRALRPDTPTLLITGHGEHTLAVQALRGGAYDFIQKPIDRDYFVASLERAIQVRHLHRQVDEQRQALEQHAAMLEATVQERTHELVAANSAKDALLHDRDQALAAAQAAVHEQQKARQQVEALAEELGRHAAELDTIFNAMADAIYVCDANGKIIRLNATGASLLGLPTPDALRDLEDFAEMNQPRNLDGTPMLPEEFPLAQALRGVTRTDFRYLMRRYNSGEDMMIRASCAPIRNSAGDIIGAVGVGTDISEIYRLERQKDEFLSIASHELKTPLTSLKGLTQIAARRLERAGVSEMVHLSGIERAINRMELLVNDLLDISRIESGKLALRMEPYDLVMLCRQAVDEQVAATDRVITIDAPETPIMALLDMDRMGQVLTNLLSNALKYSRIDQPVNLTVEQVRDEVHIAIQDHGPGIPDEERPHVFERFYRVPGIDVQAGSGVGLGLGLYISHEITERHGGRIWVESTPGGGSTFIVALPLATAKGKRDYVYKHGYEHGASTQS